MNRRGILKGLLGGAVAAPTLAKKAAADVLTLTDLNLGAAGLAIQEPDGPYPGPSGSMSVEDAAARLAKLNLRNALAHEFLRRRAGVYHLDPDLAGYRSFSLTTKLRLQQERNYESGLNHERAWLAARIAGIIE